MIIVSQDKMELVNFDKVENIWICPDEEGRFTIEATADTNATLGYYKTEERAKEIMMQIVRWQNILKKNSVLAMADKGFTFPQKYYFEMPEE